MFYFTNQSYNFDNKKFTIDHKKYDFWIWSDAFMNFK